jgi:autotransporter-associated beta strand protein
VGVNFTSQAVAGSGLADTGLASQTVNVTGFAYTGQSTWITDGNGDWGNNTNDYSRWNTAGGVPGMDGTLSANDTATFGNAISAAAAISLNGANPSLKSVTFDSSVGYTLAQGSGGSLTLNGNGGMAAVTVTSGSHTVSAPITLGSAVGIAVTQDADTLTVSGAVSGAFDLTKTGAGTLVMDGINGYTGTTNVAAGVLAVTGSLNDTAVTVATGATLTGAGSIGNPVTDLASLVVADGGTHAPGNNGPGLQAIHGSATYSQGSIFEWDLTATASDPGAGVVGAGVYDRLAVSGAVTGGDAVFKIMLSGNNFSDAFWGTNKHWDNVFAVGLGSTDIQSIFTTFAGTNIAPDGSVANEGQFYFTGNTLNWTAVPEPSSALVGLLLGVGLCRRRRA